MTRLCIICKDSIPDPNIEVNNRTEKNGGEATTAEEPFALIKCLGANVSKIQSLCQEYSSEPTNANGLKDLEPVYCLRCRRRNDAAAQILKKKQEAEEKLKAIREAIVERYKKSVKNHDFVIKRGDDNNPHEKQFAAIRSCISEELQIPEEDEDAADFDYGESSPTFYPLEASSHHGHEDSQPGKPEQECLENLGLLNSNFLTERLGKEKGNTAEYNPQTTAVGHDASQEQSSAAETNMTEGPQVFSEEANDAAVFDNDESNIPIPPSCHHVESRRTRQKEALVPEQSEKEILRKFGILRSTVALTRLTKAEIDAWMPNGEDTVEDFEDETHFKCPFEDCDSSSRTCDKDLPAHLKNQHQLLDSDIEEILQQHKPPEKDYRSGMKAWKTSIPCTFLNCDFMVELKQLHQLKEHLENFHALTVSDFEDSDPIEAKQDSEEKMHACPFNDCRWGCPIGEKDRVYEHLRGDHALESTKEEMDDLIRRYLRAKKPLYCSYFRCPFKKGFMTERARQRHVHKYHNEIQQLKVSEKMTCETCGKVFATKRRLLKHQEIHNYNSGTEWICAECGNSFKRKHYLSRHMAHIHSDKKWECQVCSKTFESYSGLYNHRKDKHEVGQYLCAECGKSYTSGSAYRTHVLDAHKRTDPSERSCTICKKMFSRRSDLRFHMKTVHKPNRVRKPYTKNPNEKRWSEKKSKK